MNQNLIDPQAWETMKSMAEPAFLIELIDIYLTDSQDLLGQMRLGVEKKDNELLRRSAHSLKSNSLSFGAIHLADVSREIEMLAKSGSLEGVIAKLSSVEAAYEEFVPELERMKNECQ
jgi:HPt (histidine-containing phosphotransfer) domain-containing protein